MSFSDKAGARPVAFEITAAKAQLGGLVLDDRPASRAQAAKPMKKAEPAAAGRGGKFGDRKDARPGGKPGGPRQSTDNKFEPYRPDRDGRDARGSRDERGPRGSGRPAFEERGPRLGDAAFRAQREAFDAANQALKKLAMKRNRPGKGVKRCPKSWR